MVNFLLVRRWWQAWLIFLVHVRIYNMGVSGHLGIWGRDIVQKSLWVSFTDFLGPKCPNSPRPKCVNTSRPGCVDSFVNNIYWDY